ncbi:MAG: hypothetical protein GXP27_09595 [Planctomycetes bacterium]|nr:hypothetical protein [Planctomycetota bacterium]
MANRRNGRNSQNGRRPRHRRRPFWENWSDEELLELRICDLDVRIEGTALEDRIERLYEELEMRGLSFRPHFWVSDDWFSPDGVPGIAVPFYLLHPRLVRLERKQMLEVEGGNRSWCMKILRHEAGHAICTAYRLHFRRRWREIFGKYTEPYPEFYSPKPYSKSFVVHLDPWYAQSHPAEDFAETFAVWLQPRSRWRTQYQGWPAMKKLRYVDELMAEIRQQKPAVVCKAHIDPARSIRKTLWEYYEEKRRRYRVGPQDFFDRELLRLFSQTPGRGHRVSAASFLRSMRPELRRVVAHWTDQYQYTIDQVLTEMIERCRELKLYVNRPVKDVKRDVFVMVTAQTMNYLHSGNHRFAL